MDRVLVTNMENSETTGTKFIAHDFCGWNSQYGRYTAVPGGATLRCQDWMMQRDWDKAQYEWLSKFDGALVVHRCGDGPYTETGNTLGTVDEIRARLLKTWPSLAQ